MIYLIELRERLIHRLAAAMNLQLVDEIIMCKDELALVIKAIAQYEQTNEVKDYEYL